MKANAPEKLYFIQDNGLVCYCRNNENDIEYTRTDAFIEKALKFIKTNVDRIVNNQHGVGMGCMDGEFRNYMEGEQL